jgi:endonuclease G
LAIISPPTEKAADRYTKRKDERLSNFDMITNANKRSVLNIENKERIRVRRSLINPNDEFGLERIIGKSDLLPINYLEIGLNASKSVCRVQVRNESGNLQGYGTGFMVSSSLMMTNNHVLPDPNSCKRSLADFNYEDDANFVPKNTKTFFLESDRFFYTSPKDKLDFTIVAVKPTAVDGTPLSGFGNLELIEQSGKALLGEYVSIIQHPEGQQKTVSIRENQVIDTIDQYIHYKTDTQAGSSGSPVFNDQWDLVALHHSGIPAKDEQGRTLAMDNQVWTPEMGEEKIQWVANEGIRISKIMENLRVNRDKLPESHKELLNQEVKFDENITTAALDTADDLTTPITRTNTIIGGHEIVTLETSNYNNNAGYNPDFLITRVPMPKLGPTLIDDCAPIINDSGNYELKYNHFSVVMSKSRRLAFFTGVNIDGSELQSIKRERDRWYYDPRINMKYQSGPELYANNDLDQGHLVRRQDPDWGQVAAQANEDTFHFTNCSPQHKNLNRETWVNLEDYILNNARSYGLKVNVFTGPVFREDDMLYRGKFQIPAEFWKIAVIVKDDNKLSATAYLQTQKNLIENLEFAYGEYKTYQVAITKIEALTKLDFGALRNYDPLGAVETTAGRTITGPSDIIV